VPVKLIGHPETTGEREAEPDAEILAPSFTGVQHFVREFV